jgi:predicted  nucleic acid-binding Zn-ribbon protein
VGKAVYSSKASDYKYSYVTKIQADLDTAKKEVENLTSQLGDRDKQLKDLKNSTDDVEGLKTKIAHQVI